MNMHRCKMQVFPLSGQDALIRYPRETKTPPYTLSLYDYAEKIIV
jgi:hypothetical protein